MAAPTLANENQQPTYLEILAYLGMTRHLGAWNSTNELATCVTSKKENTFSMSVAGLVKHRPGLPSSAVVVLSA